jgi:hypothetical protein
MAQPPLPTPPPGRVITLPQLPRPPVGPPALGKPAMFPPPPEVGFVPPIIRGRPPYASIPPGGPLTPRTPAPGAAGAMGGGLGVGFLGMLAIDYAIFRLQQSPIGSEFGWNPRRIPEVVNGNVVYLTLEQALALHAAPSNMQLEPPAVLPPQVRRPASNDP